MVDKEVLTAIHKATPVGRWQFVDVFFEDFDTDVIVPHNLDPSASEEVFYTVVRQAGPGVVYESSSEPGAKKPARNYIVLRSDTSDLRVRLLLTLVKTSAVGLEPF